ncbi:ArsR/SmtB family transcription factor [Sphingomonas sp. CJ99]
MRPFIHPDMDRVSPQAILHALSDPERARIYAEIAGVGCVQGCAKLADTGERTIPKSSLSHHFRVLREAGLIRSERRGVEMHNHARCAEVDARFPGLLAAIMAAYAASPTAQR